MKQKMECKNVIWNTKGGTVGRFLLLAFFLLIPVPSVCYGIEVVEAVVCENVQARQPLFPADSFPTKIGRIWCWSKIKDGEGTSIRHIYYYEGKQEAAVELPVLSPLFRTFSSKHISANATGSWRVEIVDANGNILKTLEFTVANPAPSQESTTAESPQGAATQQDAEPVVEKGL